MEFLENEGVIKGVIEQNNSLIRKKSLLKTLLGHGEVQSVLNDAIQTSGEGLGDNKEKYLSLLKLLEKNNWDLDSSMEEIIKGVSSKSESN